MTFYSMIENQKTWMKHDGTFNCVRLPLGRLFRSSAVAVDATCRSVRHGGSLPCTSPYTLNYFESGANVSNPYETPLAPGTQADFTRLQGHRITVVVCFAFSCSSHGCNMQIHQAVEQIEKVSVSSWLSEGERNVAVKGILAQILICLTLMRSSISLEENDSDFDTAWDAVSRLSSDDVLYILLAAPLACCSSCQFLFGCQCLFRFESMPNAVKWRLWESSCCRSLA